MAGGGETVDLNRSDGFHRAMFLLLPGQVQALKAEAFKVRRFRGGNAVIVVRHRMNEQTRKCAVAHGDTPHKPAALWCAFDFDAVGGGGNIAIPNLHILHTAGHFAANADAVATLAVAVEHADVLGGSVDFIALRIFAGFDGDGIILGFKLSCKQGAVCGGVRVPAVAVPDAARTQYAVVGYNVVAVNHVDIPRRAILQGQPSDADMDAVA